MATAELGINITARNQARGVLRSIQSDVKGLRGALGDVAKFAGGNLLASGITSGINAIASGAKMAVGAFASMANEAADFNAQISSIGAVAGASGAELAQLKQLALDLGVDPRLKVSAVEAAQAIEMLARNGLKVPDIMNGAAEATVLLANATGADFSTAADIGTDAMALFGIQANEMIKAVDGITSVTNNSKFSINDYRLALAQGGGVAATVGVSFEDFNATIAGIAPLFGSGSDAGTSFKTFLQRLVPSTDEASHAMRQLGLISLDTEKAMSVLREVGIEPLDGVLSQGDLFNAFLKFSGTVIKSQDDANKANKAFEKWLDTSGLLQNAFFDSEGQMKDMAIIAGELNRAMAGLSEEQKILQLSTIFGSDAMRAAAGIAGYTEEEFRKLQETMAQTSAVEGAAKRMDNLAGDMEIFRSVVESVRIQIGDKFQPVLREVFQSGSEMVAAFAPGVIAFAGEMANALDGAIARLANAKQQFDFLASGGNVIGGILAGVGTLAGAEVTVPIGAKVVDVDWGILSASFNNATQDLSLSIGDIITGTFNLTDYTTTIDIGDVFTGKLDISNSMVSIRWGDYVGKLDWKNFVVSLTWGDYVYQLSWADVVASFNSWTDYISNLAWSQFVADFGTWTAYVAPIVWSNFISALNWTGIIEPLKEWGAYITPVTWSTYIGNLVWDRTIVPVINWIDYISALTWLDIITTTVNWGDYITQLQWDSIVTAIDWSLYITQFSWENAITKLTDWGPYIKQLQWETFVTSIDLGAYVTSLLWPNYVDDNFSWTDYVAKLNDWSMFVKLLNWPQFLGEIIWSNYISQLTWTDIKSFAWSDFITKLNNWADYAKVLNWPQFIGEFAWDTYISKLDWPSITWSGWDDFVTELQWPSITWPGWSGFVDKLKWPSISWPGWSSFVPKFSWPSVPSIPADWWKSLNPFGGGGNSAPPSNPDPATLAPSTTPSNGNRGRGGFAPGNGFVGFGGDAMSDPLQAVSIIMAEFRLVGNEWIAKSNEMIQELTDNTSALRLLSDVQLLSTELSQSALSKNSSALASAADLIRLSARGLADAVGRTGELLANSGGSNDISISPTPIPVSSFPAGGFFGNQTALTGAGAINVTVNVENVGSNVDVEALAYRVAQAIQRRR